MKGYPRSPSGWRRLKRNEKRRAGDRMWEVTSLNPPIKHKGHWIQFCKGDHRIGEPYWPRIHWPVIRRKP